jgi:hypothetical protein
MVAPINPTALTPPRVEFIDPRTGAISREWYRFFLSLLTATQTSQQETSTSPDASSLLASYDAMLAALTQEAQTAPDAASAISSLDDKVNDLSQAFGVTPPPLFGTVTSVSGTGTVNGITLTGTVTSSGSLTLGGTLSGVDLTTQVTGTLPVGNGGTGATTLTGYVKGNGTSAFTASATVPASDVTGLATVATSGSFADLTNKPGIRSNGQNVISASTTLGAGDKGTNILIVTSGITITFPSSGYAGGEGVVISNISGGNVTLSAPGGSDFGATLPNNGSFFTFCDGGGFWRQYCYSTSRL